VTAFPEPWLPDGGPLRMHEEDPRWQDPAQPHVWDEENVSRILEAWGDAPGPDELARRSARRDKRLAALKARKGA